MKTQSYSGQVRELFSKIGVGREKAALNNLQSNCLALDSKEAYTKKMIAPPTAKDAKKMVPITNEILLYLSTLNIVVEDIISEFSDAGLYRQQTKQKLNRIALLVRRVFNDIYKIIRTSEKNGRSSQTYNSIMVEMYFTIDKAILLEPPHRSWNMAVALCRLILGINQTMGSYEVMCVNRLSEALKMLFELPNTYDYHLDSIIERTLKEYE